MGVGWGERVDIKGWVVCVVINIKDGGGSVGGCKQNYPGGEGVGDLGGTVGKLAATDPLSDEHLPRRALLEHTRHLHLVPPTPPEFLPEPHLPRTVLETRF